MFSRSDYVSSLSTTIDVSMLIFFAFTNQHQYESEDREKSLKINSSFILDSCRARLSLFYFHPSHVFITYYHQLRQLFIQQ